MKNAFLKTPVEPELLSRFFAFSEKNDLSPSVALRRVVFHVMAKGQEGFSLPDYDPSAERTNDFAQWARRRIGSTGAARSTPVIITRVTPGMKAAFEAFAAKRKQTAPAALKNIIEAVVASVPQEEKRPLEVVIPEPRSERVTVRFSKTEMALLRTIAKDFGGVREWLVALARSRIQPDSPQFSENEIRALYESNRELWAIGRNVNQIAHAINLDLKQTGRLERGLAHLKELEGLGETIKAHTNNVMRLCNSAMDRWADQ